MKNDANSDSRAELTNDLLTLPVKGYQLQGPRFEDNLDPKGTLLVFLRHLGCTFCRETVANLRKHSNVPGFPAILLVHQGTPEDGAEFFAKQWPEARAIADQNMKLYSAFGIKRGTANQLAGPRALIQGIRGLLQGHGIGLPVGDPLVMPGMFFLRESEVLWQHDYQHAGDSPDYVGLPMKLKSLAD